MCGICFIRRGISVRQHLFKFNFFEDYVSTTHFEDRKWTEVPLNEHVILKNLVLKDVDLRETRRIQPRGPDSFEAILLTEKGLVSPIDCNTLELRDGWSLCCQSVLRLRGEKTVKPPEQRKGVLLYNGEIYLGKDVLSPALFESDTEWLYNWLESIPTERLSDP